ncbi:hypothetical protein HK405_013649, partial [Cladochytrium tenue]
MFEHSGGGDVGEDLVESSSEPAIAASMLQQQQLEAFVDFQGLLSSGSSGLPFSVPSEVSSPGSSQDLVQLAGLGRTNAGEVTEPLSSDLMAYLLASSSSSSSSSSSGLNLGGSSGAGILPQGHTSAESSPLTQSYARTAATASSAAAPPSPLAPVLPPSSSSLAAEYELLKDPALTPRERRALRNKLSARNFREKRKEYIETLEAALRRRDAEIAALRGQLDAVRRDRDTMAGVVADLRARIGVAEKASATTTTVANAAAIAGSSFTSPAASFSSSSSNSVTAALLEFMQSPQTPALRDSASPDSALSSIAGNRGIVLHASPARVTFHQPLPPHSPEVSQLATTLPLPHPQKELMGASLARAASRESLVKQLMEYIDKEMPAAAAFAPTHTTNQSGAAGPAGGEPFIHCPGATQPHVLEAILTRLQQVVRASSSSPDDGSGAAAASDAAAAAAESVAEVRRVTSWLSSEMARFANVTGAGGVRDPAVLAELARGSVAAAWKLGLLARVVVVLLLGGQSKVGACLRALTGADVCIDRVRRDVGVA